MRYYHKNKSTEKKEKIKRKQYVSLDRTILEMMDNHIKTYIKSANSKPSAGFQEFIDTIDIETYNREVLLLKASGYEKDIDIQNKFKKTYKNRYFIATKKQ